MDYELYHHGVKGMKWGIRRYQRKDGSLTPKGIRKYATAGYSQDSYKSNKSKLGRAWDKITDAHKIHGAYKYASSTKDQNKARAEKYLAERLDKKRVKKAAKTVRDKANVVMNMSIKDMGKSMASSVKRGREHLNSIHMQHLMNQQLAFQNQMRMDQENAIRTHYMMTPGMGFM